MSNKHFALWLLGPTSSGKTTLASQVVTRLEEQGLPVIHFDGDEIREFFGPNLGFSNAERLQVVKTLVHLVNKSERAGLNVVVSALTANKDARLYVAESIKCLMILCYVKCSIDVCALRDPKGLYRIAQKGEIDTLAGYNSEYLSPEKADVIVDSEIFSITEGTDLIVNYLISRGLLGHA